MHVSTNNFRSVTAETNGVCQYFLCWTHWPVFVDVVVLVCFNYYFTDLLHKLERERERETYKELLNKMFFVILCVTGCVPAGSPSRGGDVTVSVFDINQPRLPSPFYSVVMSIFVFKALSTVFHSITSPDNSPFSHSVLPVLSLPYWSFQLYIFSS